MRFTHFQDFVPTRFTAVQWNIEFVFQTEIFRDRVCHGRLLCTAAV